MCMYFSTSDDSNSRMDLSESLQRGEEPESIESEETERIEGEDENSVHENEKEVKERARRTLELDGIRDVRVPKIVTSSIQC